MFQKELLIVAISQTFLCQNFNVDIKTHGVASTLDRISDKLIWLQTIYWYDIEARLMAHPIAFSGFFKHPLKYK